MAEPASTSAATLALTGAGLLALYPGLDAGTVLGAFAGGAVFVLSSHELSAAKKLAFLLLSIAAGIVGSASTASLIDWLLPGPVDVDKGVGALVASAVAVKLLLWLIASNPAELLAGLRGGGK